MRPAPVLKHIVPRPRLVTGEISRRAIKYSLGEMVWFLNRNLRTITGRPITIAANCRTVPRTAGLFASSNDAALTQCAVGQLRRAGNSFELPIDLTVPLGEEPAMTIFRAASKMTRVIFPPPSEPPNPAEFIPVEKIDRIIAEQALALKARHLPGKRPSLSAELKQAAQKYLLLIASAKLINCLLHPLAVPREHVEAFAQRAKDELGGPAGNGGSAALKAKIREYALYSVTWGKACGYSDLIEQYANAASRLEGNQDSNLLWFWAYHDLFNSVYMNLRIPRDKFALPAGR